MPRGGSKKGRKYRLGDELFQRRAYEPLPGQRAPREGSQRNYPTDPIELIEVDEGTGCWIWKGTIHTTGYPIYKGWQPARRVVFEKFCRPLEEALGEKIIGRISTCHDTRCVCPWHQLISKRNDMANKSGWIPPEARVRDSATIDISEVELLERLADRGGLMLNTLPFMAAQSLIKYGYLQAVPLDAQRSRLELTNKGREMVETRRRMRDQS